MQGVENIKEYWDKRYAKQGELTTGFIGHNAEQNKECYAQRIEFISSRIKEYAKWDSMLLDYGCGVGQYFDMLYSLYGYYVGYDVNKWAVNHCLTEHLNESNVLSVDFILDEPIDCDTLFTATVLQHNTDKEVGRILSKYKEAETFILYEFTGETQAKHMAARTVNDYKNLVFETTGKMIVKSVSHIVHGELHTLMIFK